METNWAEEPQPVSDDFVSGALQALQGACGVLAKEGAQEAADRVLALYNETLTALRPGLVALDEPDGG